MAKILYSCYLLTSKGKEAISQFTSDLPNKFAEHCTIAFAPTHTVDFEGWICSIKAVGRLKTDLVDCLLIDQRSLPTKSKNEFPHITLSTAEGVKPFESNKEIKEHYDLIHWYEPGILVECIITDIVV